MNWTIGRTTFVVLILSLSLSSILSQRQVLYDYYGRKLRITPKDCDSSSPRFANLSGICMFNLECQEQSGTVIGACVDRFLFGACCHIPTTSLTDLKSSTTEEAFESSTTEEPKTKSAPIDISAPSIDYPQRNPNVISHLPPEISPLQESNSDGNPSINSGGSISSNNVITSWNNPSTKSSPSPSSTSYPPFSTSSSNDKLYPTRFPSRTSFDELGPSGTSTPSRRVSESNIKYETMGSFNHDTIDLSIREHTTLPSPRDIVTLHPLTLETFSSVSDSFNDRPHGSHHAMYYKNGQSHDSMEHETLAFLNNKDRLKPRPSSTRIQQKQINKNPSNSNSISDSNLLLQDSTEEPPRISTFMYVDNDVTNSHFSNSNSNSIRNKNRDPHPDYRFPTTTNDGLVEEKTIPIIIPSSYDSIEEENLQSNTENIWSVVMQLGSHAHNTKPASDFLSNGQLAPLEGLEKLEDLSSSADQSGSDGFFGNTVPSIGSLLLDNTFLKLKTESNKNPDPSSSSPPVPLPTILSIPEDNFNDESTTTREDQEEEIDNNDNDNLKPTLKPWASSTYYVHTFTYPNFTVESTTEDFTSTDSDEGTITKAKTTSTTTTTEKSIPSSTLPAIGKITTWSGIGTVVNKEDLIHKHSSESSEEVYSSSSRPLNKRVTSSTTTEMTTTTTKAPSTTRRYSTRYTTRTTTTTERPETTTRRVSSSTTTEKWKKPKPYTLPPHKRPTTPEPTQPPSTRRTKPPKLVTKGGIFVKNEKRPSIASAPAAAPSIILDEDMDTNLDDFVEQVVQGLAGSLDNLNIDNVIIQNSVVSSASASNDISPDPTVNPLQVISDPSFPPFPIVGDIALTKPNVKINLQDKLKAGNVISSTSAASTTSTTQKPLDWKKDCGVRTLPKSGRIVGGTASKFGRWPWQALVKEATWLGLFSKNKCGGVLIAPKYVLTAAHCQPGFLATLTVVLGEFDISSASEGGANSITKNVRRVIVHRDYNAQTFENDIALLELDSAVEFHSHIVPVCMPDDNEEFIGRKAYVTGWGRLKYGGGVPQILHEVDVPILKNDECQSMFQKSNHLKAIRESFICAGYAEGFKDSCEGDSGGPLSIQRPNGQWVLAGTVSHGIKCAYPNLPGVYMRMTFYKPWIKRVTGIK